MYIYNPGPGRASHTPATSSGTGGFWWMKVMYAELNFSLRDFTHRVSWSVLIGHCARKVNGTNS